MATTGLAINRTPNIDILQNNLQLSAVVSGFSDANGLGSFTYQWIVERADGRGTAHRIDSANAADYAVQAADIPAALINNFRLVANNNMRYLVEIRHTDAFGFEDALITASVELQQQDATGTPSISASTFAPQSELSVDVSSVRDVNGLGTYEYTWQFYHAGRGAWDTFREDANPIYTIPTSTWDTNRISVRAAITHTDLFGDITGLGRVAIGIPRDPQGEPQVAIVNNAQVAVGVTASVNVSGITDANSRARGGSYAYQWIEPNNAVKTGQTRNIYILNQTDVRNIAATTPPKVRVTYTDELGFEFSWTVRVEVVRVEIGLQGDLVTSQVIDPNAIAVPSSYTYQWQEGDALDGQYRNIVGSNSSTYRLPQIVPPSHPFVRLSVSYARRSDQQRAPAISRGLQVAGINRASSTLGLLGDGVAAGAVYRPDLSGCAMWWGGCQTQAS